MNYPCGRERAPGQAYPLEGSSRRPRARARAHRGARSSPARARGRPPAPRTGAALALGDLAVRAADGWCSSGDRLRRPLSGPLAVRLTPAPAGRRRSDRIGSPRMSRRIAALKPQLNRIRAWAHEGSTDAWIAHQLETTADVRARVPPGARDRARRAGAARADHARQRRRGDARRGGRGAGGSRVGRAPARRALGRARAGARARTARRAVARRAGGRAPAGR